MISRPLLVIHASLTLLIPALLALLISGCKVKDEQNFGPETGAEAIRQELGKAFVEYDPNSMKVGEWAQLDQTQQLNGSLILISDMAQSVVVREDEPTEATFRAVENRRFFDSNLQITKKVDTEFSIVFNKEASASSASSASQKTVSDLFGDPIYRINQDIKEMQARGEDGTMTYHNLKTSITLEPPPAAVAGSADCATYFPNCQIRVYNIAFDMVFWENGKGEVLQREYKVSPDVPYLSAVVSECLAGLVPVENQRIFVKECTQAKNFKFGSGSTPTP